MSLISRIKALWSGESRTIQLASEEPARVPRYLPYVMVYSGGGTGEIHPLTFAICAALMRNR